MILLVESVSDRESEQYLDENSKRYARRLWNFLGIVDGSPRLKFGSKDEKLNPIKLPILGEAVNDAIGMLSIIGGSQPQSPTYTIPQESMRV